LGYEQRVKLYLGGSSKEGTLARVQRDREKWKGRGAAPYKGINVETRQGQRDRAQNIRNEIKLGEERERERESKV
jgi:hypothetical protein